MGELGTTAETAGRSDESGSERFGLLLREELEAAGLPTYQTIANRGGISKSAVSDAMRGVRIPSARTVLGIMAGLDRDPEPLMFERERLLLLEATDEPVPVQPAGPEDHREAGEEQLSGQPQDPISDDRREIVRGYGRSRWRLSRTTLSVMAGVLLVGIFAGYFATVGLAAFDGGDTRAAATGRIVLDTHCAKDGIVVASERRAGNTQLEIVFSHDCQAMWGRVLRNDGRAYGNGMEAVFYPNGAPESEMAQRVEVQDTSTAVTAMVVHAERTPQFCVEASLTRDGDRVDLGDPVCL